MHGLYMYRIISITSPLREWQLKGARVLVPVNIVFVISCKWS